MDRVHSSICYLLSIFVFVPLISLSIGQLAPSESRILLQVQQILEYPPVFHGWTNWTNFCYLPPTPSLAIVCSGNHVTELTVIGNKSSPSLSPKSARVNFIISQQTLSERFSMDLFFTIITKLLRLKVLSLVSLGLWGQLPTKINRFSSLQVLNVSSNFIYGEIPPDVSLLKNLRSLVISDNLFNGTVPNLGSLAVLEELDVSNNLLGPEFPSLRNKIVRVILRNNTFRSHIPLELKNFYRLQHLDISSNEFIGPIPSSLFSLPSIRYLNLAGNQLSGALWRNISCSDGLVFADLSHNLLIGKFPLCIGSNSSNRVLLYSWNCLSAGNLNYQHPYSFCQREALAVKPTIKDQKNGSNSKLGLIFGVAGAIMGGVGALGLLILAIFRWIGATKAGNNTFEKPISQKTFSRLSPKFLAEARHVSPAMRLGALGLPPYHVFSLEEIEEATNNFDSCNLMGEGSQGQLYKGWLRDGSIVMVRCLKLKQRYSSQSLLQHMEAVSKLRHQHLVSILGHCIITHHDYPNATNTIVLVFEYVSNGTLRSHLSDWRKREMLKWPQRVAMTIGVAKGIQFLHTGIAPGIFGNDLKIENILLDENLIAKISNYNLAMPSKVGSESLFNGIEKLNCLGSVEHDEKEDVYQLGIILLEIITGKPITSEIELDLQRLQLEQTLAIAPMKLCTETDPAIHRTFAYESLRTTVEITINCLSKDYDQRPSIEDVLWNLKYSVQVQDGWSENLTARS